MALPLWRLWDECFREFECPVVALVGRVFVRSLSCTLSPGLCLLPAFAGRAFFGSLSGPHCGALGPGIPRGFKWHPYGGAFGRSFLGSLSGSRRRICGLGAPWEFREFKWHPAAVLAGKAFAGSLSGTLPSCLQEGVRREFKWAGPLPGV